MAEEKSSKANAPASKTGKGETQRVIHNTAPSELLEGFREVVLSNPEIQEELRYVENARDVVKLAAKHGFGITEADIKRLQAMSPVQLTIPELEMVAGAAPCWCDPSVVNSKSCK